MRLALPAEARRIADLQRRSWSEGLPEDVSAYMLQGMDLEQMTEAWQRAIVRPPDARCRVLVAVGEAVGASEPVAFATTLPSSDEDGDQGADGAIDEFVVDPVAFGQGHGSRLLNACVDTLRADGFQRATIWISSTADALREFLESAGWDSDGAHRELGEENTPLRMKQVRLHTDIS